MQTHTLSIITCANRDNPYFRDALTSLCAANSHATTQRILVANGGWEPPRHIQKHFDLVVKTAKSGLGYSRNLGVEASTTEWITFFDSDDLLDSSYIKNTIAFIKNNTNIDFFFNTPLMVLESGAPIHAWIPRLRRIPPRLALRIAHPYTGATLVIRKGLFCEMRGYQWPGYAEDYDFSLRLIHKHPKLSSIHQNREAIYYYRKHPATMSGDISNKIRGLRAVQAHHLIAHKKPSMLIGILISTARLHLTKLNKFINPSIK